MRYPDEIDVFREVQEVPGIEFNADDKTTFFARDLQDLHECILAIENVLGVTPDGGWGTVVNRLDDVDGWRPSVDTAISETIPASLSEKEDVSNKDNDDTLASSSAVLYPTQHAVKGYVDTSIASLILGARVGLGKITGLNSTGNKSVTGLGFTPKIVIFIVAPPETTGAGNIYTMIGAMTSSTQFSMGNSSSTTSNRRYRSSTKCCHMINPTGVQIFDANYVSMNSGGFTINVTYAASVDDELWYIAIG